MACERIALPGGGAAIVCGARSRRACACGRPATLLCDWKKPAPHRTCDRPLCASCAVSPAPGKDLCPAHALAYAVWRSEKAEARRG